MTEPSDIKEMYEKMFAHRFTESDNQYQEYVRKPESQPPVVEDWRGQNQRGQYRYRGNRPNRSWDNRRDSSSNSYNQYNQNRGRGWGNSYHQQRQDRPYHQQEGQYGYNSGSQRFYPDRY